jgi:signal transduction histidine kinase
MLRRLSNLPTRLMLAVILIVFAGGMAGSILQIQMAGRQITQLETLYLHEHVLIIYRTQSDFMKLRTALASADERPNSDWRLRFEIAASRTEALTVFAKQIGGTDAQTTAAQTYADFIKAADAVIAREPDEGQVIREISALVDKAEPLFAYLMQTTLSRSTLLRDNLMYNNRHVIRDTRVVAISALVALMIFVLALLGMYHVLRRRNEGLVRLSAELRRALDVRHRFLASVSHDFRTPLNAIAGFAQILLHKDIPTSEEKRRKFLEQILAAARRLELMTADLLDLARMERGAFGLKEQDNICLDDLVRSVLARFGPAAEAAEVEIIGPTPPNTPHPDAPDRRLRIDPGAMERAVSNLLDNAVKFSAKGGRVVVSVEDIGPSLQISVEDTGRGIPAEKINDIWDLFGRSAPGPGGGLQGSGLGLAIARGLVEAHGGRITVRSEEGRGSRFTIHLPVRRPRPAAATTAGPNPTPLP